ncbi:MAG: YceI family protein [Crocinitomicaceae bacterium]
MKTFNLFIAAGAALVLASCGGSTEKEEVKVEMKTLSVNTENSELRWVGSKTADYFHTGSVKFAGGTAEFVDGSLVSGTFNVDMTTIASMDAELPEEKKGMLLGHLSSPDFFDVAQNAKVAVTCGAYANGVLPITISISGKEIKQDVAVKVDYTEAGARINGKFDIDFAALNVKGFQPNPEMPNDPAVSSKIAFDLNLELK